MSHNPTGLDKLEALRWITTNDSKWNPYDLIEMQKWINCRINKYFDSTVLTSMMISSIFSLSWQLAYKKSHHYYDYTLNKAETKQVAQEDTNSNLKILPLMKLIYWET